MSAASPAVDPSTLLPAAVPVVLAVPAAAASENKEAWGSSSKSIAPAAAGDVIVTPVNELADPSPREETPSTKIEAGSGISPAAHSEPAQ